MTRDPVYRDGDTLSHSSWKNDYVIERVRGSKYKLVFKDTQFVTFDTRNVDWLSLAQNVAMWERLSGQ